MVLSSGSSTFSEEMHRAIFSFVLFASFFLALNASPEDVAQSQLAQLHHQNDHFDDSEGRNAQPQPTLTSEVRKEIHESVGRLRCDTNDIEILKVHEHFEEIISELMELIVITAAAF